jgi:hypothetical protein
MLVTIKGYGLKITRVDENRVCDVIYKSTKSVLINFTSQIRND